MLLVWVVDGQAFLPHRCNFRQQLLLPLGVQGVVGLQGTAEVHHRIHAGQALGVGAHHPIGEAALLALDLLGQLTCRCQLQGSLEELIGFRFVGAVLDPQQALGVGGAS